MSTSKAENLFFEIFLQYFCSILIISEISTKNLFQTPLPVDCLYTPCCYNFLCTIYDIIHYVSYLSHRCVSFHRCSQNILLRIFHHNFFARFHDKPGHFFAIIGIRFRYFQLYIYGICNNCLRKKKRVTKEKSIKISK